MLDFNLIKLFFSKIDIRSRRSSSSPPTRESPLNFSGLSYAHNMEAKYNGPAAPMKIAGQLQNQVEMLKYYPSVIFFLGT